MSANAEADDVPEVYYDPPRDPDSPSKPRAIPEIPNDFVEDGMVALEQLRRAVPMPPYEDTTPEEEPETAAEIQAATGLNYVQHRPPQIPVPPLRPAPPPPKHHRRPEPRDSGQSRPMSARSAGPVRPTPPTRPSSARSAPLGRAVCLPTSIDATLDMTSSVAEAVAVAAAASVGISQSGPRPTTPRAAAWQPAARPWSDWSVANGAYPTLERPSSACSSAARKRYTIHSTADKPGRPARWRPDTAPVSVKQPWPNTPYVPKYTAAPPPPERVERGLTLEERLAQRKSSTNEEGGLIQSRGGGGGGLAGLMGGGKKGAPISFKTAAMLARRLSAGQARARQREAERLEEERRAHINSLRSALGTPVDPAAAGGMSTASAIEERMEEELRLAIPPPRDRSPAHLRRQIDRLHKKIEDEFISPRDRKSARKPYMMAREPSSRRNVAGDSGGGYGPPTDLKSPRAVIRAPTSKGLLTAGGGPPSSRPGTASSRPGTESSRPVTASSATEAAAATPQRPSFKKAPSSVTNALLGKFADDDGETLEALPLPLPGSARKRGERIKRYEERSGGRAWPSVLDACKDHTSDLQQSLATCSPLLKRSSLRVMIARILNDPSHLPEGVFDFDDERDPVEAPAA